MSVKCGLSSRLGFSRCFSLSISLGSCSLCCRSSPGLFRGGRGRDSSFALCLGRGLSCGRPRLSLFRRSRRSRRGLRLLTPLVDLSKRLVIQLPSGAFGFLRALPRPLRSGHGLDARGLSASASAGGLSLNPNRF